MARYSAFLGRSVEVQYRAGDVCLPASGTFVADSGRSIFLEQHFEQRGQARHFRWEIPYQYIVRIELIESPESVSSASCGPRPERKQEADPEEPVREPSVKNAVSAAAAGAGGGAGSLLPLPMRPKSV